MKQIISTLIFVILAGVCQGQDLKKDFDRYLKEKDTIKQHQLLQEWEQQDPQNAELFTSYFNYYFHKSRKETLLISSDKTSGENLILLDSAKNTIGYIGSHIVYDSLLFEKGINKIDQGIELYPNRLDMRFGKIFVLEQKKDWLRFTDEIIKVVQYSQKNNNEWTWTYNVKQEDGRAFFLSSLQTYQLNLYNTGRDDLLVNMRKIAEEVLKYYPDHIESLTNLSITYLLAREFEKGLEPLLKAEKLAPADPVVLSNIAHAYYLKGDKDLALEYYEKTAEYGETEIAAFAKQRIQELKNKPD